MLHQRELRDKGNCCMRPHPMNGLQKCASPGVLGKTPLQLHEYYWQCGIHVILVIK